MDRVEELLRKEKINLDQLAVPEDLEDRLNRALRGRRQSKSSKSWKVRVVAASIALLLIGYNFSTLAYYSKKLIGYDEVMNGSLQQLNQLGKGQTIGQSYSFKNGTILTLDGIMIDENQLLIFYTISGSKGQAEGLNSFMSIKGLFKQYSAQGGQGKINEENTVIKWLMSFEPPAFYEKTLTLQFGLKENGLTEEGEIKFKLDREKAMGSTLKKSINRSLAVDGRQIRFESILASPTQTVIKGSIQNIIGLALDQLKGERLRPNDLTIKLIANGEELPWQGGGMRTDSKGITFQKEFDPLPQDLHSLELRLERFAADYDVNEKVVLERGSEKQTVEVLGQTLEIDRVYEDKEKTYVRITSEDSTVLTRVYLLIDGEKMELEQTITDSQDKLLDGTILHTRTLHFPGTGNDLQLNIERMTYAKSYNEVIEISVE